LAGFQTTKFRRAIIIAAAVRDAIGVSLEGIRNIAELLIILDRRGVALFTVRECDCLARAALPMFQKLLLTMNAALRNGAKSRAIHRMNALVDCEGAGGAADAKVALEASKAVLGEDAKGLSVNVNVSQTMTSPGYVIGRWQPPPSPTIEGSINDE
jgi:hypothetical protein